MRRHAQTLLLAMFVLFQGSGPALAHHSFAAEFDAQKPVTLKGIVVKWEMINPHGWITMDVTGRGRQDHAVDGRDLEPERSDAARLDQEFAETRRRDHGRGLQSEGRVEHSQRRARHAGGRPQRVRGFVDDTPVDGTRPTVKHAATFDLRCLLAAVRGRAFCAAGAVGPALRAAAARGATAPSAALPQAPRRTSGSSRALAEERRRLSGPVHRVARRDEFRRAAEAAAGAAARGPPPAPQYEYTAGGRGRAGGPPASADTRIPRRAAICLASRARSISPPGFIPCRSSRTRSTSRCCTKPCTTSASFPPTTARIRRTTGRGTETRAAAGKATRSSSTSATSTAGPGWTWPGISSTRTNTSSSDSRWSIATRFSTRRRSPTRPSSSSRSRCASR